MDYGAFGDYNKRHGMERGVMRFRFADAKRTRVQSLWWNEVRVLTADGRTRMMRVVGAAGRPCSQMAIPLSYSRLSGDNRPQTGALYALP